MPGERALAGLRLALIDAARGTRIAKRRQAHEKAQWTTRAELEAFQASKLRDLLVHATHSVPHYADTALRNTLSSNCCDILELLRSIPVSRKEDRKQQPADYRSSVDAGRRFARHTGGSTGEPYVYEVDVAAISGQWAAILRGWEWCGFRFGQRMTTVGGGSVAPAGGGGFRNRVYDGLRNNRSIAAANMDDAQLTVAIEQIRQSDPVLLYGYPSLLCLIAREVEKRGERRILRSLRTIVTTSEMLFPRQRLLLQEVFDVAVHDQYGCNEVNLVAMECSEHDGWHYAMEGCLVEVLDEGDRPVSSGQVGRIVATSLDNRATPFIRYDTGDLGALDHEPCRCGRGLTRLRSLQGRSRDLVRTPDGRTVHGVEFNDLILNYPWIERYQAIQEDQRHLRVILACREEADSEESSELLERLENLTGLAVELLPNHPFEVTQGQKARVIISKVESGNDI